MIKRIALVFFLGFISFFSRPENAQAQACGGFVCASTWGCSNCIIMGCEWRTSFCANTGVTGASGVACTSGATCQANVPGIEVCTGYTNATDCGNHSSPLTRFGTRGCCTSIPLNSPTPLPTTPPPTSGPPPPTNTPIPPPSSGTIQGRIALGSPPGWTVVRDPSNICSTAPKHDAVISISGVGSYRATLCNPQPHYGVSGVPTGSRTVSAAGATTWSCSLDGGGGSNSCPSSTGSGSSVTLNVQNGQTYSVWFGFPRSSLTCQSQCSTGLGACMNTGTFPPPPNCSQAPIGGGPSNPNICVARPANGVTYPYTQTSDCSNVQTCYCYTASQTNCGYPQTCTAACGCGSSVTPTNTPTPTRTPTPTPTSTPVPGSCNIPPPFDPPSINCAAGTITWRWDAVLNANQYEVDITNSSGTVVINNGWRPASDFGCASGGTCSYTTPLTPGNSYRSNIRAQNSNNAICAPSGWGRSAYINFVCTPPTNTPTPIGPSCSINLSPAITNLGSGATQVMTATLTSVTGGTVSNVTFSSSSTSRATVSPNSDSSSPYTTTVTGGLTTGSVTITASAVMGGIVRCTDTQTLTITVPPTNTPTPPPGACSMPPPRDPPSINCATSSITWRWDAVPNANQYEVDITNSSGTTVINNGWRPASDFGCASGGVCSYTTVLTVGGTYRSNIRAQNSNNLVCGASVWGRSNFLTLTCAGPTNTPTPTTPAACTVQRPVDPPLSVCPGGINWSWNTVAGATEYWLRVRDSGGNVEYDSGWLPAASFSCNASLCNRTTTGLSNGTYNSIVQARGVCGASGWSGQTFHTLSCVGCNANLLPANIDARQGVPFSASVSLSGVSGVVDRVNYSLQTTSVSGSSTTASAYPISLTAGTGVPAGAYTLRASVDVGGSANVCSDTSIVNLLPAFSPWFQVGGSGGAVAANGSIGTNLPWTTSAPPPPYLVSDAVAGIVSGTSTFGNINSNNSSIRQWLIDNDASGNSWGGMVSRRENSYLGLKDRVLARAATPQVVSSNNIDDAGFNTLYTSAGSAAQISTIAKGNVRVFTRSGDLNISGVNVANRSALIFVDGNVNINGNITVTNSGFFAIFASGDITVGNGVGTASDLTSLTSGQIQGIYYAGGRFVTGNSSSLKLRIDGTVIGMTGVELSGRDYAGSDPSHLFVFRPDLTVGLNQIGARRRSFQEILTP